jgi:hypothetical protein
MRRRAERRVTCQRGHLWTAENSYVAPDGERQCRECLRIRGRAQVQRRLARERAEREARQQAGAIPPRGEVHSLDLGFSPIPVGECQCGCGQPTLIAPRTSTRRGQVKGQPMRYLHGHRGDPNKLGAYTIDPDTGCWIWQLSTANGYGQVWFFGRLYRAHRLFYILLVGDIPEGLQIDHRCRLRLCVNPDHLEAVTGPENVRRSLEAV